MASRSATVAQLAIAWVLHQPGVSPAIAGSRDGRHVHENCEASNLDLTGSLRRAQQADPAWPDLSGSMSRTPAFILRGHSNIPGRKRRSRSSETTATAVKPRRAGRGGESAAPPPAPFVSRVVSVLADRTEVALERPVGDLAPDGHPGLAGEAVVQAGPDASVHDLAIEVVDPCVMPARRERRTAAGCSLDVDLDPLRAEQVRVHGCVGGREASVRGGILGMVRRRQERRPRRVGRRRVWGAKNSVPPANPRFRSASRVYAPHTRGKPDRAETDVCR
jgi:hypothetical protein